MKQVQKNSFICYILSDQIWWCNVKQFLSYSKNYIFKFMQADSWHHKLFHLQLSFWIWKAWKGREKNTKTWISWEWKELFRRNKKAFFIGFKGLSFGEITKIDKKQRTQALKISQYSQENTCVGVFIKKRLQHRCFPVNIAKFLRTPF